MSYTEPLLNQVSRFLMSMGFGFILCVLYLAFSFLRMIMGEKKWMYIISDMLFGITATVLSFFFMIIYNNGQVRFNLVLGQMIGGIVLYFTIGRYLTKPIEAVSLTVRKAVRVFLMPAVLYLRSFPSFFIRLYNKLKIKKQKNYQLKRSPKKHLKRRKGKKEKKQKRK